MTVTDSPFQIAMTQGAQKVDVQRIKGTPAYSQLIAECDAKFNLAKQYRQQFEKQWYMNLAFYFGRQYVQWSTASATPTARLVEGQVPPWRVRLVSNKIRHYIRKELSKVLKEKPMGFVVPQSADDDDLAAARAGDTLSEYFWRTKEMPTHIRQAMFWTLLCGTGFIKDWYDDNYEPDPDKKFKGDMFMERITPFHLYIPDVQEESIENQPYVIHATAKNKDTVSRLYPGMELTADVGNNAGMLEQRFLAAMDIKESSSKDMVYVKEMWIKPNGKYPDGAVVAWAGTTLLHFQEGWPFLHKDYPFTKFDHIPTGKFYADSTIVDLIPLQKEYNRTNSQLVEAKNKMAKPQLIAPQGSIDPNKITSEPGLIITYQPGFAAPQPLPLASIPSYVENTLTRCKLDMDDISSQHEITRGSHGGLPAATAISFMQEEDDSVLSPTIDSMEKGVEKLIRHMLNYVGAKWDVERTVQVVGQNGQIEVVMLDKDKLRSNYSYTIQSGSATPRSLAAKQAFIMELGKMGWIPPDKALRYLGMPDVGRLYEEMQLDTRYAQRENLKMQFTDPQQMQPQQPPMDPMTGQPQVDPQTGQPAQAPPPQLPVKVNTWDDHHAHIMEHDAFRKTQSFEDLDPSIQAIFEEHVNQHKVYILVKRGIPMDQIQQAMNDPLGVGLDSLLAQTMGMPAGAPVGMPGQPPSGVPPHLGGIPGGPPMGGPPNAGPPHMGGPMPPPQSMPPNPGVH